MTQGLERERHQSREPRSNEENRRWPIFYFILAGFNFLTVSVSFYVIHQTMGIYAESVAVHAAWAQRLDRYSELGEFAARVNAPGNDVFDSGDVPAEEARLVEALEVFDAEMARARDDLLKHPDSRVDAALQSQLDAVAVAMNEMVAEARLIYSYFRDDRAGETGRRMATMDRKYAEVNAGLAELRRRVGRAQGNSLAEQAEQAAYLRSYEFVIGSLVCLMVLGLALYGHRLAVAFRDDAEAIRSREMRLQAIQSSTHDGIITADERGTIESVNPAGAEIFGHHVEAMLEENLRMLMPEPTRSNHDSYLEEYLNTGKTKFMEGSREVVAQRADGSTFSLEIAVTEVELDDRTLFCGVFRDITDRKKAALEIEQLGRQNALLLNSAGEGLFGLDLEGKAIFANPAAAEAIGWTVGELDRKPMHEVLHHSRSDGSPYPNDECPINLAFRTGEARQADDEVFWRKDGTSFPVEYVSRPIRDEKGAVAGAVVTFRDVSEKRRLEGQLAQAQKLESIGQLAAGVAHEINTPSQYVGDNIAFLEQSFAELVEVLKKYGELHLAAQSGSVPSELMTGMTEATSAADLEFLQEEIPRALAQSRVGIGQITHIVRAMKEFSHPGTVEKTLIDLNRAIESTVTVSRSEWKYIAEMEMELDADLPPVSCQAAEFNQVILNIVVNAAHALAEAGHDESTEKGHIRIETRREGEDWVLIEISDDGPGMSEEVRRKVFDPFFTTKEVGEGTGQGLAIAHSVVVDRHGGKMEVESEVGYGTNFHIRLPIHPQPQDEASP